MKIILSAILILLVLFVIGLGIFISTFDIGKYKPFIISRIENTTGKGITIDKMDLSLNGGLGISFSGLLIYPDITKKGAPALSVKSGAILLEPLPLLWRKVVVNKLIFRAPDIGITLGENSITSIGGFGLAKTSAAGKETSNPAVNSRAAKKTRMQTFPVSFSVSIINILNGTVTITGSDSRIISSPVTINHIDVMVKDLSVSRSARFDIKMGVFSNEQNITGKGKCVISPEGLIHFQDSTLNVDMDKFDTAGMINTLPVLKNNGISGISGKLGLDARSIYLTPSRLNKADAVLELSGGTLRSANISSPFSDINMKATLKNDTLSVFGASFSFGGGTVTASGAIRELSGGKLSSMEGNLKNLSISAITPAHEDNAAYISGTVSGHIKGTSKGFDWPGMAETIAANGQLSINKCVIHNKSIVREVLSKISVIPGLLDNLESRLSDKYRNKLNSNDTEFHPISMNMRIDNGTLHCNDMNIGTNDFTVTGGIEIGLVNQPLGGKVELQIGTELSAAFVKIVNELVSTENGAKRIVIPVKLKGTVTNVEFIPDLNYLAKKMIASEVQNNINKLLKGAFSVQNDNASTTSKSNTGAPQNNTNSGGTNPLADLLKNALEKQLRKSSTD